MSIKFFRIPVRYSESFEEELNAFLRSHRVLDVAREFVPDGDNSFWSLCVDYHESHPARGGQAPNETTAGKPRVDYRERLSPADFAVFSQLRQLRKELAAAEAIPVYLVLTNEQLSQIVEKRVKSLADLAQIEGLGPARLEKYGAQIIELLGATTAV